MIIDNEWDDKNKLSSLINDCINIEENIKEINKIKDNIKNYKSKLNLEIKFSPGEESDDEIIQFLESTKKFGKIILMKNSLLY